MAFRFGTAAHTFLKVVPAMTLIWQNCAGPVLCSPGHFTFEDLSVFDLNLAFLEKCNCWGYASLGLRPGALIILLSIFIFICLLLIHGIETNGLAYELGVLEDFNGVSGKALKHAKNVHGRS